MTQIAQLTKVKYPRGPVVSDVPDPYQFHFTYFYESDIIVKVGPGNDESKWYIIPTSFYKIERLGIGTTAGGYVKVYSASQVDEFLRTNLETDYPDEDWTTITYESLCIQRTLEFKQPTVQPISYSSKQIELADDWNILLSQQLNDRLADIEGIANFQNLRETIVVEAGYLPKVMTTNQLDLGQSLFSDDGAIAVCHGDFEAVGDIATIGKITGGVLIAEDSFTLTNVVLYSSLNTALDGQYIKLEAMTPVDGLPTWRLLGGNPISVVADANYIPKVLTTNQPSFVQSLLSDDGTTVTCHGALNATGNISSDGKITGDELVSLSSVVLENVKLYSGLDASITGDYVRLEAMPAEDGLVTWRLISNNIGSIIIEANYIPKVLTTNQLSFVQSLLSDDGTTVTCHGALESTGNISSDGKITGANLATESSLVVENVKLYSDLDTATNGQYIKLITSPDEDGIIVWRLAGGTPDTGGGGPGILPVTENIFTIGDAAGSIQNSELKQDDTNLVISTDYSLSSKRSLQLKAALSTGYNDTIIPQNQTRTMIIVEDFNETTMSIGESAPMYINKLDANTYRIFIGETLKTGLIFRPPYYSNTSVYWLGHDNAFQETEIKANPVVKVYSDFIEGANFQEFLKVDAVCVEQKTVTATGNIVINPLDSTLFYINYDSTISSINFQPAVEFGNAIVLSFFRTSGSAVIIWPSNWFWINGIAPDSNLFALNTQIRIHLIGLAGYILATMVASSLNADNVDTELTLLEPWVENSALSYFNASGALVLENPVAKIQNDTLSGFTFETVRFSKDAKEINDILIVDGVLTLNIVPTTSNVFRFTHDTDITSIVVNIDSTLLDAAFTVELIREEGLSTQIEVPLPTTARYPLDDTTIKYATRQAKSVFTYLGRSYFMYCGTFRS